MKAPYDLPSSGNKRLSCVFSANSLDRETLRKIEALARTLGNPVTVNVTVAWEAKPAPTAASAGPAEQNPQGVTILNIWRGQPDPTEQCQPVGMGMTREAFMRKHGTFRDRPGPAGRTGADGKPPPAGQAEGKGEDHP